VPAARDDLLGHDRLGGEFLPGLFGDCAILRNMARRERPRDPDRLAGQARLVEVRVIGEPDGHDAAPDSRGVGIVYATVTAVLVAALLVIVITTVAGGGHRSASAKPAPAQSTPATLPPVLPSPGELTPAEAHLTRSLHSEPVPARESGLAGIAAVYGDPFGCLRVTIAPGDPSYARVVYNRVGVCGRNNGTITAIYHRADGEWLPVLDAKAYACPGRVRSQGVASELDVCP
jgi:hypothetical protein